MRQERLQRLIVAGILFLLVVAPLFSNGVNLLVDWIWFGQEGYRSIYKTALEAQIALSGLGGMGLIVIVGLNLLIARALAEQHGFHVYRQTIEFPDLERFAGIFRWVVWVGVLLAGYVIGQWSSIHWREYLLDRHAVMLGQTDPVFNIDLGFYLFQLSYHWFLYHLALVIVMLCLVSAAALYLLEGGKLGLPPGPGLGIDLKPEFLKSPGVVVNSFPADA